MPATTTATLSTEAEANHVALALPSVTLDTTIADLYRQCKTLKHKHIGQVLSGFSAAMPLTEAVPRNSKFIYQDTPFTSGNITPETSASTAAKYLSLITQRDAFISGNSSCVFFHINSEPARRAHNQQQVDKTLQALPKSQRPNVVFCEGPRDIPVEKAGIDIMTCKEVPDGLEKYPQVVPCEKHWFLNSKGALAASGLPTPRCEAVTADGFPAEADACCNICNTLEPGDYMIPDDCRGPRRRWITEQSEHFMQAMETRPLPFILKNQETFGGAGTYFARTEEERQEVLALMRKGLLRRLLSTVNASNAHLHPATLIFSDVVADPVSDHGLTFFVPDAGQECIYLGASQQIIDEGTSWIGSTIDYHRQDALRHKFEPIARQISAWLQSHGYIGPAGADILETRDGQLQIVDLNIRTTGSLCLPLMQGHFVNKGFGWASLSSLNLRRRRSEFIEAFAKEFEEGRMTITSWFEDEETGESMADVVIGGRDEADLKALSERMRAISGTFTF